MKIVRPLPPEISNAAFSGATRIKIKTGGSNITDHIFYAEAMQVEDGPGNKDGVLLFVPAVDLSSFTRP